MTVDFRQQLIDMRGRYDLSQKDMAKISGIMPTTYRMIENGTTSSQSGAARRVRKNTIDNEQRVRAEFLKRRRMANRFRIPNIPGFYERLEQITDEDGRIRKEMNPEMLRELQYDLGVIKRNKPFYRSEFARLLKEYRGNVPRAEVARRIGVAPSSYGALEYEINGPKSRVMQRVLVSEHFTKEQRRKLTRVYNQMVREELK